MITFHLPRKAQEALFFYQYWATRYQELRRKHPDQTNPVLLAAIFQRTQHWFGVWTNGMQTLGAKHKLARTALNQRAHLN